MELSELAAYANEKYQIQEQHKWADFPGFSVLCHPQTGKWVALLMRQWDTETGTEIERCDLKCGRDSLVRFSRPYLKPPVRMQGSKWVNVAFEDETEKDIVFQLFDKAISAGNPSGYKIVLASQIPEKGSVFRDTALPFAGSACRPRKENLPERLRKMKHLYKYGRESFESRAENFYRQAVFMEDYEDDVPWSGDFFCYFPTYHDLTTSQLRGYFTWRAQIRRGEYLPIATSAAYIYLYELLNGVGAQSPEDALGKLKAFEAGYPDAGTGGKRMRQNLRRWMLEYAVLNGLEKGLVLAAADPDMIERDAALTILRKSDAYSDGEVFSALCVFGAKKTAGSPVVTLNAGRGKHLFSEAWRSASAYCRKEKRLFHLCFGEKRTRRWYPLSNAVYYEQARPQDSVCELDESRSYRCRNGIWRVTAYENLSFEKALFQGFLHETDAKLRRYLKTGRYLKENPADEWAVPYIEAVIEADRRAAIEAARPRITIDLSGLDKIRIDAAETRDSLLTEEDAEEFKIRIDAAGSRDSLPIEEDAEELQDTAPETTRQEGTDLPLDAVQIQILRGLLLGQEASEPVRANHLMPSIAADLINEALFDEIGDNVLICENDRLSLVEDYIEDLDQLLGGTDHGQT